ncbi:hypothetical protein C8R47DRAFT_529584 [Mycena vitilis]|nr:hypothetical protein C8R47DRAFT_529584 [Mycena vitilis]
MALITTRSTLMHAALAHVSPELREFDLLAFGKLRRRVLSRRQSLSSMPIEILLLIRTHILPVLIAHFIAISSTSLQHYEASLRRLICPQCRLFNEYVYGLDVWKWHLAGPCSCAAIIPRVRRRPNPKQFRDRHHWLETYLSRKSLRFRGLSAQSPSSSAAIWNIVSDLLGVFGCEVIRMDSGRRGPGMPLLSRWDRQSILVVPAQSTRASLGAQEYCSWTVPVLLGRLERDLGLSRDYSEPCRGATDLSARSYTAVERATSTLSPSDDAPVVREILAQILDAIAAPLTAIFSILLSFVTLFFTVLCYYSRPGALRLF